MSKRTAKKTYEMLFTTGSTGIMFWQLIRSTKRYLIATLDKQFCIMKSN